MIDFSQQKVLQVKKRDGSDLILTLKHVPFKKAKEQDDAVSALHRRYRLTVKRDEDSEALKEAIEALAVDPKSKELKEKVEKLEKAVAVPIPEALEGYEYVTGVLALMVENFSEPDFESFEWAELTQIMDALKELRKPSEAEKKSE